MSATAIVPSFRYDDAPAAIDWLCRVFGFSRNLVVDGPNGTIAHAQLTLGQAMIMLGSAENESEYGALVSTPSSHGKPTGGVYVVVPAIDAHYVAAKAGGAEIVRPIRDEDYGGRGYTCRDIGGYIWAFGSYDPWAEHA